MIDVVGMSSVCWRLKLAVKTFQVIDIIGYVVGCHRIKGGNYGQ